MTRRTNATNSNTNAYQHAQQGPHGATRGHQSTTKRPLVLIVTPHALKLLESDQPASETVAAPTNVGSAGQFWSRRRGGRQGRAFGASLRGRRALTALRRRKIGLPCCRGSLSATSSDVSDLASPAQSASACCCKTLQNASIRFRSFQNPQCKVVQFRAKKCFRMLLNVSFCCVHTCAPRPRLSIAFLALIETTSAQTD